MGMETVPVVAMATVVEEMMIEVGGMLIRKEGLEAVAQDGEGEVQVLQAAGEIGVQ